MSKFLEGLNPSQAKAVETINGPVQINAVAGSGKTRVLTHRIAYMLEQGIKPSNILCTTFTKEATEEMINRMSSMINPMQLKMLTIGTFHSIAYRILSKEYKASNHRLVEALNPRNRNGLLMGGSLKRFAEDVKKKIMYDRTVEFSVKEALTDLTLPQLLGVVGKSKNNYVSAQDFQIENSGGGPRSEAYIEFYLRYEQLKRQENCMDMDDLLFNLVNLFTDEPAILAKYQKFYKYLLVDEAQDNNLLQYKLIRMLGAPEYNIFIVGDDDQCQPVGERVLTTQGYVNIEDLSSGKHKVIPYNQELDCVAQLVKGADFNISSRHYEGNLFRVIAAGGLSKCTPNHKWVVSWSSKVKEGVQAVYLLRKGDDFSIGRCQLLQFGYFGPTDVCKEYGAEEVWVLKTEYNMRDSYNTCVVISSVYGLPLVDETEFLSLEDSHSIYGSIHKSLKEDGDSLYERAVKCLSHFNKDINYPIWDNTQEIKALKAEKAMIIHACNLESGLMELPVHDGNERVSWHTLHTEVGPYNGLVYSLDVPHYHTYITNGIVTHNCMYSFRGAKPEEFIHFTDNYRGAKQIALEDNYRSNPGILDVANLLIRNNTIRLEKQLKAHKQDSSECVSYSTYKNESDEAKATVEEIKTLIDKEGISPKEIAILYRTNAQSRSFEDNLIVSGLPYVIHGGISFYERKEIKDIIAYLELAVDHDNDSAFKRVINTPSRYLGRAFMDKISALDGSSYACCLQAAQKDYERRGVQSFVDKVDTLTDMSNDGVKPVDILDYILDEEGIGYQAHFLNDLADAEEEEAKMENISTLRYVLQQFTELSPFLDYIHLMTSTAKLDINGVQLLTVHKSKGLEYPVVFVVGASEGILPHFRAVESEGNGNRIAIEEERRLMYVAVTRAERLCYVSSILGYNGRPAKVSRFASEMKLFAPAPKEK